MRNETMGHLCFLIGLGFAGAIFAFTYLFLIKISFVSVVSLGVVSMIIGVYISERFAKYFDRKFEP